MRDLRTYSEMSLRMVRESLRTGQNGLPAGQLADAQLIDFVEGVDPRREKVAGVSDCRAITGRHDSALPSPELTPALGASDPATTPARRQAWECQGLKLVIDNGRRSAPTPQGLPTPTLRRPLLIVVGGREHHTRSG